MEPTQFYDLLTPGGQEALSAAMALNPREMDFLALFQVLGRQYQRELARVALSMAILRGEAASKYPQAEKMYFTRPALEQASSHEVSCHRARRYQGFKRVFDLGCSIGGDTLVLAQVCSVVGVDRDPLRLAMAQANLAGFGLAAAFVQADLRDPLPFSCQPASNQAVFFDPARRTGNRRVSRVEDYLPPLSSIGAWLGQFPALGVKISPGVQREELEGYDAEVEFISLRGDLKEAVLWFGPLQSTRRRATLLPGGHAMYSESPEVIQVRTSPPRAILYEPDPAILRAQLVGDLAVQLSAYQLDPDIAYLTAEEDRLTPFARSWRVEDWFPFGLKHLRAYLRERGVGRVVVKKRGSPLQPEALIRQLRLQGDAGRVVFLTHLDGKAIVVVCHPRDEPGQEFDTIDPCT